jgi:sigma-54 specific flagellar transcriptional regulator A
MDRIPSKSLNRSQSDSSDRDPAQQGSASERMLGSERQGAVGHKPPALKQRFIEDSGYNSRSSGENLPSHLATDQYIDTELVLPLGVSQCMQHVRSQIMQLSNFDVSVLITGDSGVGKEVIAQQIHANSSRSNKPFIAVNCGAIQQDLLESEFFGHEKGAFTGAIASRAGRFEMAQGGTLFLDEIGDMPLLMQVKLLRVLQEKYFERVGGNHSIHVDVRIIAATHRNLPALISAGLFREDLFYRLNVFPIHVTPLQDRTEDLPELLSYFMQKLKPGLDFSLGQDLVSAMNSYSWPGNVRELQNLVQRLAIVANDSCVGLQDLPEPLRSSITSHPQTLTPSNNEKPAEELSGSTSVFREHNGRYSDKQSWHTDSVNRVRHIVQQSETDGNFTQANEVSALQMIEASIAAGLPDEGIDLKQMLMDIEVAYILKAIEKSNGIVAKAARLLSLRRTTLVEKMKKLHLNP